MRTKFILLLAIGLCSSAMAQVQPSLPKEIKVGKERVKARQEITHD